MTGPSGNSEFCFSSTTMNIEGIGSLFPLWPVIKCLMKFDYGFLYTKADYKAFRRTFAVVIQLIITDGHWNLEYIHVLSGCWRPVPCCFSDTVFYDGFWEFQRSLCAIVLSESEFAPSSLNNIFWFKVGTSCHFLWLIGVIHLVWRLTSDRTVLHFMKSGQNQCLRCSFFFFLYASYTMFIVIYLVNCEEHYRDHRSTLRTGVTTNPLSLPFHGTWLRGITALIIPVLPFWRHVDYPHIPVLPFHSTKLDYPLILFYLFTPG